MSDTKNPVWRYRADADGNIESRLFDDVGLVPKAEGWQDSPAKCTAPEPAKDDAPAKPATRRKRSAH